MKVIFLTIVALVLCSCSFRSGAEMDAKAFGYEISAHIEKDIVAKKSEK